MPHETINRVGLVVYRTKLMDLNRARAFALCVEGNTSRFQNTEIVKSTSCRADRYFVTFQPVSESRLDAMHQRQWDARADRAANEEFFFWPDMDKLTAAGTPYVWWCFSVASGETYQVTLCDCTCPDYICRCQRAGLQCKHMQAWSLQRAAGTLGQTDKRTPAADSARAARVAATIDLDFPA